MAEFVMKDLLAKAGVTDISVESSATSSEEIGNSVYPPAAMQLSLHGIDSRGKRARRFTVNDYNNSDMIIVMEDYNIRNLMRIVACDCEGKVWKLLDFVSDEPMRASGNDISDPWYHDNFEKTYNEILAGCKGLMHYLGY